MPFASRIKWHDVENRRNFNMFLDMVRGFTTLRAYQRERDDEGNIITTVEDFRDAQTHHGKCAPPRSEG